MLTCLEVAKKRQRLELGFHDVPHGALRPGQNKRRFFPGIAELASTIEESQRVMPLQVTPDGEIIAGERRWRATKLLNENAIRNGEEAPWAKIPCEVIEVEDSQKFDWNVQENMGRQDFRFIELAHIFREYRETYNYTVEQIGKRTGYNPTTVSAYIAILDKLHPDIISRLENGELISTDILIRLKSIKDQEVQKLRLEQWLGNPITESGTEAKQARARTAMLSRRKLMALIKVLQQAEADPETIAVASYIAGLRETLPHKWHLKLSRPRPPGAPESGQ